LNITDESHEALPMLGDRYGYGEMLLVGLR